MTSSTKLIGPEQIMGNSQSYSIWNLSLIFIRNMKSLVNTRPDVYVYRWSNYMWINNSTTATL